jgi:protein phosphatase
MSKIVFFGKSDVGLRRSNNEDAFILSPERGFVSVADGMGGRASGEIASRIFIETAEDVFLKNHGQSEQEILELVQSVFQLANKKILDSTIENPQHRGMGCTAELVVFYDQYYIVGHVGDSRTYLYREGELRQITRDHSLVQEQIEQGLITLAEARHHSLRHVILRAVGVEESLKVDVIRGRTLPGDIFLLCSDGLTDMVEDNLIKEILSLSSDLEQKVNKLIELAKSAGGYDNITVTLCEVVQD